MLRRHATKTCYEDMLRRLATKTCYEDMLWRHAMKTCYEDMHAMKTCYEDLLWRHATIACYDACFGAYEAGMIGRCRLPWWYWEWDRYLDKTDLAESTRAAMAGVKPEAKPIYQAWQCHPGTNHFMLAVDVSFTRGFHGRILNPWTRNPVNP